MNQIRLLKFLDKTLGKILIRLLQEAKERNLPTETKRILFIRPGGIGDAVLLLPAIHSLKTHYPDAEIDVLGEKRNAGIFKLSADIRSLYLYDRGLDLFRCLKNNYDVVIDTEQWHRLSAVVASLTGSPIRIGFDTNERGKLFTHRIPYSHDDYEVYSFLRLLEPLEGAPQGFHGEDSFITVDENAVPGLFSVPVRKEDTAIAIFTGASVPERRWGADRFGKVAEALAKSGHKIVILGSKEDTIDAGEIMGFVPDAIDLIGKTTLSEVAAVLKNCRVLITADSGLMHLAVAVGTPTVALFGSGREKKWAPPGKGHKVLNLHLSCSPCTTFGYTPRCKRNVECLLSISPEEVLKAAEDLLNN